MNTAGSRRHAAIVTVLAVALTLLAGCNREDLILDLNKGDSIRLVGLADNFPCDDPKYAKVKKIETVELRFSDGSSQRLCTRDPSQGPPRSAQHIREDCDKLVKQDVYRKVRLSGLYWPGAREHKFWTFEIVSRFLFESGLSFVEVRTSNYIGHELSLVPQKMAYRDPVRPYLRIYFADASSEFCAPFDYRTKTERPFELISLVSRGLRPGQCIAFEPIPAPTAQFEIETTSKEHSGVKYFREKLLDRQDRTVAAEYLVIDGCANNSRASKGFPWTAIEVVPTPNAPTRIATSCASAAWICRSVERRKAVRAIEQERRQGGDRRGGVSSRWSGRRVRVGGSMKRLPMALLLLAACAGPGGLSGETVGEQFRKALANVDAYCRERRIGPYLDPSDAEYRRKVPLMNCEVLKIKPFDLSAVLATPEGKFAYSIELPAPLDQPRVRRADYRSTEEYFNALCRLERGETAFKRITSVDGIAVLRVYPVLFPTLLGSYSEESNGVGVSAAPEERLLLSPPFYQFVERPLRPDEQRKYPGAIYLRFERDAADPIRLIASPIDHVTARYAYTWRATPGLDDRQNGVLGGELLLLDRQTGEVVGIKRSFSRDEVDLKVRDRVRHWSLPCPDPARTEDVQFLKSTLIPRNGKG